MTACIGLTSRELLQLVFVLPCLDSSHSIVSRPFPFAGMVSAGKSSRNLDV